MSTRFSSRRLEIVALILILLLAAGGRFYRLDLAEYKLDEANLSRLALNMAHGKSLPLQGIESSVGLPNGPLSVWLLAIPYFFSSSPIVATGFIAALNVLAVAMTFGLTRRVSGVKAGLVAALLFAAAPWAVLNSRKLWAQDLLPPFVVAYLWTAYLAFVAKKPWLLVAHVLTLSACIQLHYSALTFVPLTLVWLVTFWWRRWPWRIVAVALVAGAASIAPFAYQALRDSSHAQLSQAITIAGPALKVDADALHFAWLMTTGAELHSLAGPDEFRNLIASTINVSPLLYLEGVLVAAGLLLAVWRAMRDWRQEKAKAGFILATALLAPVLFFTWHAISVYPHYFILIFPSPFILVGMLVEQASIGSLRFPWRAARTWAMGALTMGIAAAQMYAFLATLNFVSTRATPGGYGAPVGMLLRVVSAAEQRRREMGNVEIIVRGSSDDVQTDSRAAAFDALLNPNLPHRFVNMSSAQVYPAGKAVFVSQILPIMSVPTQFPLRPGEDGYNLSSWNGLTQDSLDQLLAEQAYQRTRTGAAWTNGVELLGYHVYAGQPGQDLRLSIAWRVEAAPPGDVDYHWTNQLFDAKGKRIWQKDDVGFPASSWRAGDLLMTDFSAPLDPNTRPGLYNMRVGMYTFPDIKTVPLTDGQGYAEIGPVEIQ